MVRDQLIVMVKEPRPGRVKTRLGRGIGHVGAVWWFRHHLRRLLRRLRDPRWDTVLAVSPDYLGTNSRFWPQDLPRRGQGPGHLGDRMARQLRAAPRRAAVIGADIPDIDRPRIARAFAALGAHDAVFGPAEDGGYWLVGLKHPRRAPPGGFQRVRWSTENALADSVATLPGYRITYLETLADVDTVEDLKETRSRFSV